MEPCVLGLSLEEAIKLLRAQGFQDVRILESRAPRNSITEGTLRVIRQSSAPSLSVAECTVQKTQDPDTAEGVIASEVSGITEIPDITEVPDTAETPAPVSQQTDGREGTPMQVILTVARFPDSIKEEAQSL